jgi:NADP-dependent 3-hydroxy acid dehydrogenase YdfG
MKDFAGKVAVITGGGTGIGAQLAIKLSQLGMKVVVASTNKEKLEAGAEAIRKVAEGELLAVVCDVSDRTSVQNLHDTTIRHFGRVDLVVCNAGVTTSGAFLEHRESDWDWVYDVVLKGTMYCIQIFYPQLCKQKSGHIVIVGSQAGMVFTHS